MPDRFPTCLLLASALFATPVFAASFDCANASGWVEETICSDATLGELDVILAKNYQVMLSANIGDGARVDLRRTQREWLARRNQCSDRKCLTSFYEERIDTICLYPVISGAHPGPACKSIDELAFEGVSSESTNDPVFIENPDTRDPSLPLPPTIQTFALLVLDKGYRSTKQEDTTGYNPPDDYLVAALNNTYQTTISSNYERECAHRVAGGISDLQYARNRPSEAAAWLKRFEENVEYLRKEWCQRSPDILHASLTFVHDVDAAITDEVERRQLVSEAQADQLKQHAARTRLQASERSLQRQRQAIAEREPLQQSIAEAEQRIAENEAEIKRLEARQQRENEMLVVAERSTDNLERARQADSLRSGQRTPQNFQEAIVAHSAKPGFDLVHRPLLQPDGKFYHVIGFIAHHDPATRSYVIYTGPVDNRKSFLLIADRESIRRGENKARIDGAVEVVGQYIANDEDFTGTTYAVLRGLYIEFN